MSAFFLSLLSNKQLFTYWYWFAAIAQCFLSPRTNYYIETAQKDLFAEGDTA